MMVLYTDMVQLTIRGQRFSRSGNVPIHADMMVEKILRMQ